MNRDAPAAASPEPLEPPERYRRRLAARRATAGVLERRDRRIGGGRLAVFVAGVALGVACFGYAAVGPAWIAVPLLLFVGLVVAHELTLRRLARARLSIEHYERGLARIEDRWAGLGGRELERADPEHPFAADLDLLGPGSLFELLCTARTRAGEQRLAGWLVGEPPALEALRQRQRAVVELAPRLDLREDLALLADGVRAGISPGALVDWAAEPPRFGGWQRALTLAAGGLTAAAVAGAAGWSVGLVGPAPLAAVVVVELVLLRLLRGRLARSLGTVERPERELALLAGLLRRLAAEPLEATACREVQARLGGEGGEGGGRGLAAAAAIDRLGRLVGWLDAQRNALFAPVAVALLWPLHFGLAIERWRARYGARIGRWLEAVGELEALCSLATYAYEHPEDPLPELSDAGPLFEATSLGHPLLPRGECVRNDVRLDVDGPIAVVSGSNMSGKSTLLRTVGINAALAMAGGPVRAATLRLSPLTLGATIRVEDSLRAGRSRFFAEVRRLRQLFDLADGGPLLFLLDELLAGTNSADRRAGAVALLEGLRQRGAIGLVTTHDLALAEAAEGPDAGAGLRNVHFADRLAAGELVFDYRLRPGTVSGSTGLALMRSVGLPV